MAQWLEHRTGNVKVMGFIPVEDRIFSGYSVNCLSYSITAMITLLTKRFLLTPTPF